MESSSADRAEREAQVKEFMEAFDKKIKAFRRGPDVFSELFLSHFGMIEASMREGWTAARIIYERKLVEIDSNPHWSPRTAEIIETSAFIAYKHHVRLHQLQLDILMKEWKTSRQEWDPDL